MQLDDSALLKSNKKYAKYHRALHSCLVSMEKVPISDFASLTNGLGEIQRTVESFSSIDEVPDKLLLCRVLGKCLDPHLALMGVHRKAIETLSKILARIGPNHLARDIPLFSMGIFALFPLAAIQTRPDILTVLERYFVPLPGTALLRCLGGLVAAVLPALEEAESSDMYQRVTKLLDDVRQRVALSANGSADSKFFYTLWSIVRNVPSLRVGALRYLRLKLPRAKPVSEQEIQDVSKSFISASAVTSLYLAEQPLLVQIALSAALTDPVENVQRLALEVLIFHFPLHEEQAFEFDDKVKLVCDALLLLNNPQNSVLRRVFMWFYGGDHVSPEYFKRVSMRFIQQSFENMLQRISKGAPEEGVLGSFIALQRRPEGEEHFAWIIPPCIPALSKALENCKAANRNSLFEVVPWKSFLLYVQELLVQVRQVVTDGDPTLGSLTAMEFLSSIRSVLDLTRAHYISKMLLTDVVLLVDICRKVCNSMLMMCDARTDGWLSATDFIAFIRRGLELFHILYFGIIRGSGCGVEQNTHVQLFQCIADVFSHVMEKHVVIAATADSIFTSASSVSADDVTLFSELSDTIQFVFVHCAAEIACDDSAEVPPWVKHIIRIARECPPCLALCAARLYFELVLPNDSKVPLLSGAIIESLANDNVSCKIIQRLWPLMTVSEAQHHVGVVKLLVRIAKDATHRELVNEVMKETHLPNCRYFCVLFRVCCEHAIPCGELFFSGLLMMLSVLDSSDVNQQLISHAFLQHSVPYLSNIVDPLMSYLVVDPESPCMPPRDRMQLVIHTFSSMRSVIPDALVHRLISLPPPECSPQLTQCFAHKDLSSDASFPISSFFGFVCFVAFRIVRHEHTTFVMGASAADDELMLAHGTPSFRQGDDTPLCIASLQFLSELLTIACALAEPPEFLADLCLQLSAATVDLLDIAISSRLPASQVHLLKLQRVCLEFLDCPVDGGRRRFYSVPDEPDHSKSARASIKIDPAAVASTIAKTPFFQVFVNGLISAAVAELHPTLCCSGLLGVWKSSTTRVLRFCHGRLATATKEFLNAYCRVVLQVSKRPLSTSTAIVIQRCFDGLSDVIQFLHLPSTVTEEGATISLTAPKPESVLNPIGWFASNEAPTTSNREEALKELLVSLDGLIDISFITLIKFRGEMVSSGSRTDITAASTRVETAIRLLVELLVRNVEKEFFERTIYFLVKRNKGSVADPAASTTEDSIVLGLLASSSLTPPLSVIAIIDQLLNIHVRRRPDSKVARQSGDGLTFEAASIYFLLLYCTQVRTGDRGVEYFSQIIDCLLNHFVSNIIPSPFSIPLTLRLVDALLKRCIGSEKHDRRVANVVVRMLECMCPAGFAESHDAHPTVVAANICASLIRPMISDIFARDPDRLAGVAYSFFNNTVVPAAKTMWKPNASTGAGSTATSLLLALLNSSDAVVKRLKTDIVDFIFEPHFFDVGRQAIAQWRAIISCIGYDRSMNQHVLSKFTSTTAMVPGLSLVTDLMKSKDNEAFAKARTMKRLAFYLLSQKTLERDLLGGLHKEICDAICLTAGHGKNVAVRMALLSFRILMTKLSPKQLQIYWPIVLPELIRVLSTCSGVGADEVPVVMDVLKVIDFSIVILPAESQVFRWVFFDDANHNVSSSSMPRSRDEASDDKPSTFTPLIRRRVTAVPASVDLTSVRLEWAPSAAPVAFTASGRADQQPVISIPERCYLTIPNVEKFCAALSALSNCTDEDIVTESPLPEMYTSEGIGARIVRRTDSCDMAYVSWLLEGEFARDARQPPLDADFELIGNNGPQHAANTASSSSPTPSPLMRAKTPPLAPSSPLAERDKVES